MPSPGKYVIKKKYPIADSPSSSAAVKRSATLSTSGRSFTTGESKVHFQKPHLNFIISKSSNESKAGSAKPKLTKAISKKTASTVHTSIMYDESFLRYVEELDSYFKASELRNQSSEDAKRKSEAFRNRVRYANEASTSMEATSSVSLSDARSYSLDSPKFRKKRSLPRVSVVYDTAPHIDLLDSPRSFSETASYYTTPDQDRSFITTPSDNCSFFVTASEQSSYLTAELDSLDESHTFVQDLKQFSSQETLYNEGDLFKDDDYDEEDDYVDEDEMRDRVGELALAVPSSSSNVVAKLSKLNLRCHKSDDLDDEGANAKTSTSHELTTEAKVRRSNFVRSTCIDLEEEEGSKNEVRTSKSAISLDEKGEYDEGSTTKCCPV